MTQLLTHPIIYALGWTILHSLWQVSLIALGLYVLLQVKQAKSPVFRYNVAISALIVTSIVMLGTFIHVYQSPAATAEKPINTQLTISSELATAIFQPEDTGITTIRLTSFWQNFTRLVAHHAPTLALCWMAGVILLIFRFLGGITYIFRLKNHCRNTPHAIWQQKACELSEKLPLIQPVRVAISHIVSIPMVAGYIRPVILLPASVVAGLPAEQLEMILAHEIAHLYRRDHLVNLLQAWIEIVLFYHPALWWMSAVIRREREYCCDDIALKLTGDTLTYAKALVTLEENRETMAKLVLAASGPKGSLFQRVERILDPAMQQSGNNKILASLMMAVVLMTAGSSLALSKVSWFKDDGQLSGIFGYDQQHTEFESFSDRQQQPAATEQLSVATRVTKKTRIAVSKPSTTRQAALEVPGNQLQNTVASGTSMNDVWEDRPVATDTVPDQFTMRFSSDDAAFDMDFDLDIPDAPDAVDFSFSFSLDTLPVMHSDSLLDILNHSIDALTDMTEEQLNDSAWREDIEKAIQQTESSLAYLHDSINVDRLEQKQLEIQEKVMRAQSKAFQKQAEMMKKNAKRMEEQAQKMALRAYEQAKENQAHLKQAMQQRKRSQSHSSFESATQRLERELQQDGFVTDGKKYTFDIKKGQLKINGKRQPNKLYKKYADLLDDAMNIHVEEGSNFSLSKETDIQ